MKHTKENVLKTLKAYAENTLACSRTVTNKQIADNLFHEYMGIINCIKVIENKEEFNFMYNTFVEE